MRLTETVYKKDNMAIIRIEDGTNADDIECIFHTLSKNTWSIAGGATATLMPVDAGTWSSHGLDNRIEFFNPSDVAIGLLTDIDVAVSTDPFESVKVGDSGGGTVGSQFVTWTIVSK
jgi:hypothetical protein